MAILKHLLKIVGDQVPGTLSGFIFHITIETLVYGCILVSKDGIVSQTPDHRVVRCGSWL